MGAVRVRPPNRPVGWWVCGGLAVAAVAGGAVAAVYGIMTYFLKMSMMYSLAWKAATGVAAAEGLALGGWSCRNVRTQQAEADKAAAEVVRLRKQATQELAALRALLQQQEVSHSHEVSSLTALNERLTRLTHSLQAENSGLQGALDRAAAERKALEAAAALECKRAETSAMVGVTADATGRVVGEVEQLSRGQQQLVALVLELREDVMGLVAKQEAERGTGLASTAVSSSAGEQQVSAARRGCLSQQPAPTGVVSPEQEQDGDVVKGKGSVDSVGSNSSSSVQALDLAAEAASSGSVVRQGSSSGVSVVLPDSPAVRVCSVRGGVNATMAATVCGMLEL